MQQKFTPGIISGNVIEDSCWKPFARVGVAVLSISPALVLALCMEYIAIDESPVGSMIFETMIPAVFAAICLFFFNDWINTKCGLLKME